MTKPAFLPTVTERMVPRIGMSRSEVAMSIGVSPTSVDVMVKEGRLPPPRMWHSRKIWIVSEIEAAMMQWPTEEPSSSGFFDGATT